MPDPTSAEVAVVTDASLRIKFFSDTRQASDGLDEPCRIVGQSLIDYISDAIDREKAAGVCAKILKGETFPGGGRSYREVVSGRESRDGRSIVLFGPHTNREGQVDGVIYARFRAETEGVVAHYDLEPQKLYEAVVENASEIVFLLDNTGVIQFVNSRVGEISGFPESEFVGKSLVEIVHPDDAARCRNKVAEVIATGVPFADFDFRVVTPDDAVYHLVANGSVIETVDGLKLLGICRDVTESVELRERLVARNDALSALNEIVLALSRSQTIDEALEVGLDQILRVLGLSQGAVMLGDPTGNMRVRAYAGVAPEWHERWYKVTENAISGICRTLDEPVFLPDVLADNRIPPQVRESFAELGARAVVVAPLRCGQCVVAVLLLVIPSPCIVTREQMEFLNLATGILGPAVENAKLHSDLADRVNRLAMLERLAKSVNSGGSTASILGACFRETAALLEYDVGIAVLFDGSDRADVFRFDKKGEFRNHHQGHMSVDLARRAAEVRGPRVIRERDPDFPAHTLESVDNTCGSGLCTPLVCKNATIGLLKVWSNEPERYGDRETEIIQAAAEHLAMAVCNARLYEDQQAKSKQLECLAMEAQHRIKNNLQMITGLLSIPGADSDTDGAPASRCLRQIQAIATVQDLLSAKHLAYQLGLRECLAAIAAGAIRCAGRGETIELSVKGDNPVVSADAAAALGIIVNELVNNAVVHGLNDRPSGRIGVEICREQGRTVIEVTDDGVGLPSEFLPPGTPDSSSGLGLVNSLSVYGLGGTMDIGESDGGGTRVRITF